MMDDFISRQAAIDAPEKFIKDCNPEHFVGHQKFVEFMDNSEIGSFGNWQFANGFNMGLTAAEVAIKKLPTAEKKGKWIYDPESYPMGGAYGHYECDQCGEWIRGSMTNFCPNCGARMEE